jgi:four helix bundle protein
LKIRRRAMSENAVLAKSFSFALRVVAMYQYLTQEKKEYVLSKKALDTGTSVGEHVEGAQDAEERAIFIQEMGIALRAARRTRYWLLLLHEGGYLADKHFESMLADCEEVKRLLISIVKKSRSGR